MSVLGRLGRLFRPLDTTTADVAIARLEHSTRAVHVRARALRMDIGCGDPGETAQRIRALTGAVVHRGGQVLREVFSAPVAEPIPADMQDLLSRIP